MAGRVGEGGRLKNLCYRLSVLQPQGLFTLNVQDLSITNTPPESINIQVPHSTQDVMDFSVYLGFFNTGYH